MATVSKWTPFGVALNITATGGTVTRTSATAFTVKINASWETHWSGAVTNYAMVASSGGGSVTLNADGNKSSGSSGSFTGTYSISGNSSTTKTISVTFKNSSSYAGDSATKTVSFSVTVPAWVSYKVSYNANGGSGAPSAQTKWKDQTLTLSSTKPTRSGYSFLGWSTSSTATSATYSAGGKYTANATCTLYAVWKANTYKVTFNANGGVGGPTSQTKTYGVTLTLSSSKPTRTNYIFLGWNTSASATVATYKAGGAYTSNVGVTLYAVWQLDYTKPRITKFSVDRSDDGSDAEVRFDWSCDRDVTSISIECRSQNSTITDNIIPSSLKSGSVEHQIGNGSLDEDTTYTIRVTVTDSGGSYSRSLTLPSRMFPIDVLVGGNGISFGKAAEKEGYADFAFKILARGGIDLQAQWVSLDIASGFKLYGDKDVNQPVYKVWGNIVTVTGVLSPTSSCATDSQVTIASGIEQDYCPQVDQVFICQGSNLNRWACTIRPNGTITLSRYGTTDYGNAPAGAWLPFTCTYQI